jgi:hypothetical protein
VAVCVTIVATEVKKLLSISTVVNNVMNIESFVVEVQQCIFSTGQPTV